jgi:hypothetical protein
MHHQHVEIIFTVQNEVIVEMLVLLRHWEMVGLLVLTEMIVVEVQQCHPTLFNGKLFITRKGCPDNIQQQFN